MVSLLEGVKFPVLAMAVATRAGTSVRSGPPRVADWSLHRLSTLEGVTSLPVPTSDTRWRCTQCGNLTRFDVTRRSRVREFLHVDLAGEPTVEEREVLDEVVESVRCRWCDGVGTVDLVPRPA
jgi:hypothetical protein